MALGRLDIALMYYLQDHAHVAGSPNMRLAIIDDACDVLLALILGAFCSRIGYKIADVPLDSKADQVHHSCLYPGHRSDQLRPLERSAER